MSTTRTHSVNDKSVLITGANSGLGFEAAKQLAELGYKKVILACRTIAKGEEARRLLVNMIGRDPFETIAIDVSDIASANQASDELIAKGVIAGKYEMISDDGIELTFAASLIGHHILASKLLNADIISGNGRIVLVSSEGARGDMPSATGLKLYDFATSQTTKFGENLEQAMKNFATRQTSLKFDGMRQYATTKLFSTWWVSEMANLYKDRISVFAVSPGSSMNTNVTRHAKGFTKFLYTKVMPIIGPYLGVDQSIPVAAKRYVDVLVAQDGKYKSGLAYMSAPKKVVGKLIEQSFDHLYDPERRKTAFRVIEELSMSKAKA
jgi:NAD(P)-dependent dehydrogenase (short-subunit alcohol dehydrogenase family)